MAERSVLVLGATGMLGHAAVEELDHATSGLRVASTSRRDGASFRYDVADGRDALADVLARAGCRYVLNAIGVLAADIDERQPESVVRALDANARFPHILAAAAREVGCRILHVSTDAVFSGRSTSDYVESTPIDPSGVYGLSKALGEVDAEHVVSIRCSIIGRDPRRRGLIEWVLRAPAEAAIDGYTDYVWTPVTVPQLLAFVRDVVIDDRFDALRSAGPVVHFAPNPPLSKFDLVAAVRALTGGVAARPVASPAGPCRRVLATTRAHSRSSSWPDALRALFPDITGDNEA